MPAKAITASFKLAVLSILPLPPSIFRAEGSSPHYIFVFLQSLFHSLVFQSLPLRGLNELLIALRIPSLLLDNFSSTKIYQDENNVKSLMGSPWYHSY